MFPGVVILRLCLKLSHSFMLIISSAVLIDLVPILTLPRFTAQYVRAVGRCEKQSKSHSHSGKKVARNDTSLGPKKTETIRPIGALGRIFPVA